MEKDRLHVLRRTGSIVLASFIICLLAMGALAALKPAARFSNTGALPGQPDGLVEPDGDRHDSYAWSLETMADTSGDEYLYVGSNRDLLWVILNQAGVGNDDISTLFSGDVAPSNGDMRARIFRKRTDGTGGWEVVYTSQTLATQAGQVPLDIGYRGVVPFAASSDPAPSLYFGTIGAVTTRVVRITPDFEPGQTPETVFHTPVGSAASLRSLAVYDSGEGKKLYVGAMSPSENPANADLQIWESAQPSLGNWRKVASLGDFPGARAGMAAVKYGGVWDMIAFNGWLYAFVGSNYTGGPDDGFMVFKGRPAQGEESANDEGWHWVPVVSTTAGSYPNGVGNPSNVTASPFLYSIGGKDYVYVGTFSDVITPVALLKEGAGIETVLGSLYPCQVYRFDAADKWEMIVGNPEDSNGVFSEKLGNFGAGFFNLPTLSQDILPAGVASARELSLNQYAWRMGVYRGKLYVTTFDAGVVLDYARNFADTPEKEILIEGLVNLFRAYNGNPPGFDLYATEDGMNFEAVTTDGFGDPYNYGGRTIKGTDDALFVGTANPFYGCQVWKLEEEPLPAAGGGGGCSALGLTPFALLLLLPLATLRRR